ncbi:unnamed protein product [Rhodiola kirilowii]
MDKTWMGLERSDAQYIQGIVEFVEFAKQNGGNSHICPCRRCLIIRGRITTKKMFIHLINNGMMNRYHTWTSHGEDSAKPSQYMLRQQWLVERYGETSSGVKNHQSNPTEDIIRDAFPFQYMQHEGLQMNMDTESGDLDSRLVFERYKSLAVKLRHLYTLVVTEPFLKLF